MDEVELIKLLGQSGVAVAALVILGRIVWRVGTRMIRAIDLMTQGFVEHTKADLGAWIDVGSRVDRHSMMVAGKLDNHAIDVGKQVTELRASISDGFSRIQKDLAVLGTRIDTVIDWSEKTPAGAEPRYLHERPSERHTQRGEVPVVQPGSYRRTRKDDD